ncbi:MAG TPA: polysaccharide deacetylase family protein [Chitinophagaceae bacterium]|nr:polysaccharide deacetylase family protein [Chitinophagaceae bacterium]
MGMVIRNFLFHRVNEEKDVIWPPMKPVLFHSIIKQLTRKFTVVSLENYLNDPGSFKGRRKLATVCFDDGYKDNIEFAAPILKKFNCPASFYVVSDCIDKNIPTWTYILDNIFQKTKQKTIVLHHDFVPEKFKDIPLALISPEDQLIKDIKIWLKKISNQQRLLILKEIGEQCSDVPLPVNKMMSWNDIRQLGQDGFIIGSHSHTHPLLASLEREEEISAELTVSAQKIKQETGKWPQTISYPVGNYDERVVRLSKEAGYQYGLAVGQQFFKTGKDDHFKIPRAELHQEPAWKVQMRISGMYSLAKRIWP